MKAIKRSKSYLILFLLIIVIIVNTNSINPSIFHKLRISGSTPPVFSNFSPFETTDKTPDISIQVNDSESGLNIDSAYFAFTTNGSEPNEYSNPYRDNFNDNKIADYWSFRNQDNGSFVESGKNITITDLNGDHNWQGDDRSAPFMYQTIAGDVIAQVKLSVTLLEGWDIAGLLIVDGIDNFFKFQYTYVPFGPGLYNIALWTSISGTATQCGVYTLGLVDVLWMRLVRSGDEIAGFYSLDGNNFNFLGYDEVPFTQLTQVGMFVGDNTNATFDDWQITPWIECTGINGTTASETMIVHEVPFNHYSENENKIKFKISDMNDNVAVSSTYTVNITEIKGPVTFSNFQPNESNEKNPVVQISVQDSINGINTYSASYAFSTSGRDPVAFMNPYSDEFDDGIIQSNWEIINPLNGILKESVSGLNFTDIDAHVWNATDHEASCLTEDIAGIFETIIKINHLDLKENKSGGIIAILDDNHAFKVLLENKTGTVNVTFYLVDDTNTNLIGELTPSQIDPIWLKLSRDDDDWTAQYSIDGDTYATYFTIGSYTFTSWLGALTGQSDYYPIPRAAAKVGLIVENGASLLFEDWNPTPKIEVSGIDGSTSKEDIIVNPVYFDQYSETDNIISFRINSTNNQQSISSIYTVNSTTIYEFRDYTLLTDESTIKIIDGNGNAVWTWDTFINAADLEMLPNGNILAVKYGSTTSANAEIWEINITTNEIVWNLTIVGGQPLNWTHDVDYLGFDENGDETFLIADTSNNRVVECYRNGTIKWDWNATDHYTYGYSAEGDPLLEGGWDWTHLNDADRLPDGTTMISLRNFDKVIIVNTTKTGEILWEYGEYGNDSLCQHQHNPEFTPQGTILIADSENDRIVEVNMTSKEIIWEYAPTGEDALSWPRDADILPNGNMLIADSAMMGGHNRIWEINIETKEVVWYFDTSNANYDADRLDTLLPVINIKNPINKTYDSSIAITISIENEDPWYDEILYRIYDKTDNIWVTTENVSYTGPTQVFLKHLHSYTIHVWSRDIVMEGGAYPTSRAIIQSDYDSIDFSVNLNTQFDPSKPFPGNTLISPFLSLVSPEGDVLWSYHEDGKITWDAERLSNGNYLFSISDDVHVNPTAPLVNHIIEMTPDFEVIWNYTIKGPQTYNHEVHDVDKLSNGNYLIANMNNDSVIEVNSTYDIVWEWRCIDHLPLPDPIPDDWVHLNDVDRLPNGNTLITLRNYDTVIEVNVDGDIVWQYGDLIYVNPFLPAENHTKLWGPHNADRLKNGNTMIADSLHHRCIEVNPTGKIVWEVNQSHISLMWPRDCDKLPNGNVLIADSWNNRIIEINSTYDIVWEYYISGWTYDADRIDSIPPIINVHSISQGDILDNNVMINISSPDLDTDTIWYGIWNESSGNWVDLTSQGGTSDYQIYEIDPDSWVLEDGEYVLWVWANDTGYPTVGSDQHINVREIQISFEVGFGLNILKPISGQVFDNSPFEFKITLRLEGPLNKTWYTLNGGSTNYTFTGLKGIINQSAWDAFSDGVITLTFYATDTLGNIEFAEVNIEKDTQTPIIDIISPVQGDLFGPNAPSFNVEISDDNLENMWYTLDNGLNNYTFAMNNTLNQYAWDGMSDGIITLQFYAIDLAGNIGTAEINIEKDAQAPTIIIYSPVEGEIFGNRAPLFNINVSDIHLESIWYSFDGGLTNYSITNNTIFDQNAWAALGEGNVTITFFARDAIGNEAFKEITVIKNIPKGIDPMIIFVVIISITSITAISIVIIYFVRKKLVARNEVMPKNE